MCKRIIAISLLIIVIMSFSSCNHVHYMVAGMFDLDTDIYRNVDYRYDEEQEVYYLEYQNEKYYSCEKYGMFHIDIDKEDWHDLGWYYCFPFNIAQYYYSYTTESPDYIFPPQEEVFFFKETFDYKKEIFIVEGTTIAFEFSEIFTQNTIQAEGSHSKYKEIRLRSQKHNSLYINAEIWIKDEIYYVFIHNMDFNYAYQLSDNFRNALIENNIIS